MTATNRSATGAIVPEGAPPVGSMDLIQGPPHVRSHFDAPSHIQGSDASGTELAEARAYESPSVCPPLNFRGGTGSWVRPVAVV